MSKPVAIINDSSIVTISTKARTMLVDVNVSGMLEKSIIPSENGMVRPRSILMTHETARASIGAPVTPKAFILGLSYLTLAYAYGQGTPETLAKGAPKHVMYALETSCEYFKKGAGNVTLSALSDAIAATLTKVLALPITTKKAKTTGAANVAIIDGTAKRVDEQAEAQEQADKAEKPQKTQMEIFARENELDVNNARHDAQIEAEAEARNRATAEAEAKKTAEAEANRAVFFRDHWQDIFADMSTDDVLPVLEKMAEFYGMKLTKARAKKTA